MEDEMETRALQLIERIYEASVEPSAWTTFIEELSEAFGGAAIALSVQRPGFVDDDGVRLGIYLVGLLEDFKPVFYEHHKRGLPWGNLDTLEYADRFGLASELFPDEMVEGTDFYQEFMMPQGLAPEGPVVHNIHMELDGESSGIAIYRREGRRPFTHDDLALGDSLIPHLRRAFEVQRQLGGYQRERLALTEVIDRLPTGVVMLDSRGRPVICNRSAERIATLDDGFRIDTDCPRLSDPQENTLLRKLIDSAIEACLKHGKASGQVMPITRPSGKQPFVAMVTSLLGPTQESSICDSVAALFIGDPADVTMGTREVLESLYSLTRAEAELVGLLAAGNSLDQIATTRGITMNTARSQLKQVFAKTDTKRQGELVQLVLTGIATIAHE